MTAQTISLMKSAKIGHAGVKRGTVYSEYELETYHTFLFKCISVIDYSSEMLACSWPSGYDQSKVIWQVISFVAGDLKHTVMQSNLLNQFINAVCI